MAVNKRTGLVEFASSNLAELLSVAPDEVLGQPAPEVGNWLESLVHISAFEADGLKVFELESRELESETEKPASNLPSVIKS
ncbi:hypothetical protein ABTP59_18770, partial [Acinetobacter baumannii]